MRALGLDPGLGTTGYGVVDSDDRQLRSVCYGVITTKPEQESALRLYDLYQQLCELLVSFPPEVVAVEQLFFGNNSRTAIVVGQARGVILLVAAQHHLPVYEYTPMQVKQAITGYGQADKKQIERMVSLLLGLNHPVCPDDAADALAIAICYHHSSRWNRMIEQQEV